MTNDLASQRQLFSNRLRKRYRHLRKWARRNGVVCYRLYDRDIPEVPLVVDLYDQWLHVGEYYSPHKSLPGPPELYQREMTAEAAAAVELPLDHVFYKQRRRMAATEHYGKQSEQSVTAVVPEAGLSFEINLSDYVDVGLFLDHRITRSRVHDLVHELGGSGRVHMLNLFSYTASFSVYAADAGATTTSVDLSRTYTRWAQTNFQLNEIPLLEHTFLSTDVMSFLASAAHKEQRYQIIVADPPTFSASKRTENTFSVQRDHGKLLAGCADILAPGGQLLFSTNHREFRLNDLPGSLSAQDISAETIPEDFRNQRIHHAWLCTRSNE